MRATAILLLILLFICTSLMVCKSQTMFRIVDAEYPKEDTFKVELLETTRQHGKSKWHLAEAVVGYKIVKINYDPTLLVYHENEDYIEIRYLDKNKRPVPDSIIVWQSAKYKEDD